MNPLNTYEKQWKMLKSCLTSYCTPESLKFPRNVVQIKNFSLFPLPADLTHPRELAVAGTAASLYGDLNSSFMHRRILLVKSAKLMPKNFSANSGKQARKHFLRLPRQNHRRTEHIKYLSTVNKRILLANRFLHGLLGFLMNSFKICWSSGEWIFMCGEMSKDEGSIGCRRQASVLYFNKHRNNLTRLYDYLRFAGSWGLMWSWSQKKSWVRISDYCDSLAF